MRKPAKKPAMKKNGSGILARLAGLFLRDQRGLSAIEFAFVFPVMAAVYLGGTAVTQGIVIKRKVTLATRTIGDLVSQDTILTDDERTAVFAAGAAIMQPYPTAAQFTMTVSSVNVDKDGNGTVEWSDRYTAGQNTTGHTVGSDVDLPDGVNEPNTHVIWTEGSYAYTPPVGAAYFSATLLKDEFYLRPRRVINVQRCSTDPCPPPP
jgi:Flp pilus assembly protein TadG